jgi:hypothetical protein
MSSNGKPNGSNGHHAGPVPMIADREADIPHPESVRAAESGHASEDLPVSELTLAGKPRKQRVGRPPSLTADAQKRICEFIMAGNYFEVACRLAGIDPSQAKVWAYAGAKDRNKGIKTKAAQFNQALEEAQAKAEARFVLNIAKAGEKDWSAAKFMLQRKFPKRWGPTENEAPGVSVTLEASYAGRTDDELRHFLEHGRWPEDGAP